MYFLGAALEKKSVRDMAAGLNRLGGKRTQLKHCHTIHNK